MYLLPKKIHCVGIGGSGLSGLAAILRQKGHEVSGSDQEATTTLAHLETLGIRIQNKLGRAQAVIYSLAIPASHAELKEAKRLKIPTFSYPEAVGVLTRDYYTIAICGTHGKSTTTAMIAKILIENNFDPTVIVGTKLRELHGQNYRLGKSKILVLEACEYKRAFLNYSPNAVICHTLEADHLDYYKDFDDYKKAFQEFAFRLPQDGYFFANVDDENIHEIFQKLQQQHFPASNSFSYGMKYDFADFFMKDLVIFHHGREVGKLLLQIPGIHNRSNALAAFAMCATLGIAPPDILKSLHGYRGAARRFEEKGRAGRTLIIDDYGHHPTEIRATLQAAREKFGKKKICVVFQPHQYNRTKNLFKEFAGAFGQADFVIIPNIYEVRDSIKDRGAVSAQALVEALKKNAVHAKFGEGISGTTEYLKSHGKNFDVIITMGAGNVWKVGEALVN